MGSKANVFTCCTGLTTETTYVLSPSYWGCACMTSSRKTNLCPFPRHHIQDFARHLFGSVACELLLLASIPQPPNRFSAVLHNLRLIHTDLKPENILLIHNDYRVVNVPIPGKVWQPYSLTYPSAYTILQRNGATKSKRIPQSMDIRPIDFGSATFESEYHLAVVCTRHYRAPEIILGTSRPYIRPTYSVDIINRAWMVVPL